MTVMLAPLFALRLAALPAGVQEPGRCVADRSRGPHEPGRSPAHPRRQDQPPLRAGNGAQGERRPEEGIVTHGPQPQAEACPVAQQEQPQAVNVTTRACAQAGGARRGSTAGRGRQRGNPAACTGPAHAAHIHGAWRHVAPAPCRACSHSRVAIAPCHATPSCHLCSCSRRCLDMVPWVACPSPVPRYVACSGPLPFRSGCLPGAQLTHPRVRCSPFAVRATGRHCSQACLPRLPSGCCARSRNVPPASLHR